MTRKDYVKFAESIKRLRSDKGNEEDVSYQAGIDDVVDRIADIFQADNFRFNRQRFFDACGAK